MQEYLAQAILLFGQGMAGIFAVLGVIAIIVYAMQKFGGNEQ